MTFWLPSSPLGTYSTNLLKLKTSHWTLDRFCWNDKQINNQTIQPATTSPYTGWWFQPLWKILVKWGSSPNRGVNKTCLKPPPSIWQKKPPHHTWVFVGLGSCVCSLDQGIRPPIVISCWWLHGVTRDFRGGGEYEGPSSITLTGNHMVIVRYETNES